MLSSASSALSSSSSSSSGGGVVPSKFVRVLVHEARALIPMDPNGLSDPFVVVVHNGDKKGGKSTPIVFKNLNPVWNASNEFTFKVDSAATDTVQLVVWDFDKIGMNDFEGQVTVPVALSSSKPNEPQDMWLALTGKKGKKDKNRGEVHISLTFIDPSAPAYTASAARAPPSAALGSGAVEWLIPFSDLELSKELGHGAFGVVYKGKWRLQDCAIKVLPKERMGPKELEEFRDECALMASIRPHRNLVTFLGVSMDDGSPLCLVTDFVDGGALDKKLADPAVVFDWPLILKLAKGICAGMHHLHEEGLLHRDLAARNILLSASNEPLVADFGLSKKVDKLHQSNANNEVREAGFFRGPYKWMAVESLQQNVFSKKTDVWGYGVTLWEILSRSLPFPDLDIYQAADAVCNAGLRLPMAPAWPPRWVALMQSCWEVLPDRRPTFVQIMERLTEIEKEMAEFGALAK